MAIAKTALSDFRASRKIVSLMGRVGYGARGVIYLMVGISAARATFDPSHRPSGFTESLRFLQDHWTGGIVLVALATGMACLASWLAVSAVYRRDHPGSTHWLLVAGLLGDASIYIGFMASLVGMILGAESGKEDLLQSWVGWLVAGVGGRVILGFAAAVVVACGAGLVAWGVAGDIEGPLELPRAEKRLMLPIGRYGTAGRGLSIALVGFYLCISAIESDPRQAHELGGVLTELRALPGGIVITTAFALAFISSSALDFVVAAYRRFDPGRTRRRTRRHR